MPAHKRHLDFGPVFVTKGKHKGRIGDFDDDDFVGKSTKAIVYFGHPILAHSYHYIPFGSLSEVDSPRLVNRHNELTALISPYYTPDSDPVLRASYLEEFSYVNNLLTERLFDSMYNPSTNKGKTFISHSSADKQFVRGLAVDLTAMGIQPWLDEWEILAGESVPQRISEGIENSDFVIVVLSKSSTCSKWVETEWQAKYWKEVNSKSITVIPVVIDDCEVPTLLRHKLHVDFRKGYSESLQFLSRSLQKLLEQRKAEH